MLLRPVSHVLAAALFAPFASSTASSQHPAGSPDTIGPALQRLADSLATARPRLPGIVIAVRSRAFGRGWSVAAGVSDSARRIPLQPDQPMRIASNTKTYVAAALLRLMEDGRLALGDPLSQHLPARLDQLLRRDGYDTDAITIEQVLSHRAGLNEHPAVPSYAARLRTDPRYRWTREEQLQWLVDSLSPVGPPGEQFHYSDSGYTLLGAIIERYANQPLGPAVRRLFAFDTLGLRATWWETMEPVPVAAAPRAHQYLAGFDSYDIDPSFDLYGGGGIVAPMSEVARFLAELLEGRVFAQPATLNTMLTPRSTELAGYGLGIFGTNIRGLRGYGHSGFWGTTAMVFPEAGVTIAIAVTEQSELRMANAVMERVLALFGAVR